MLWLAKAPRQPWEGQLQILLSHRRADWRWGSGGSGLDEAAILSALMCVTADLGFVTSKSKAESGYYYNGCSSSKTF